MLKTVLAAAQESSLWRALSAAKPLEGTLKLTDAASRLYEQFCSEFEYSGVPARPADMQRALGLRAAELDERERRLAAREAALEKPVVLLVLCVNDRP